jgi:DNA repair protein RadC
MTVHLVCDSAAALQLRGATDADTDTVRRALAILGRHLATGATFDGPTPVRDYLRLRLAAMDCEMFGVLWLNGQHALLIAEEVFRGTLTQTSVYPREIVRRGLQLNAAAAIVYHNHPSGLAEPSRADEHLTRTLKSALELVDIRLLDHLVVGVEQVVSFAERGLM